MRSCPREQLRLDDLRQELQSINQTWSRAAEIGAGIHGIDPPVTHSRQLAPAWQRLHLIQLAEGLGDIRPARHQDHHLGLVVTYGLPGDARGGRAMMTDAVNAASDLYHLREPMA